MLPLDEGPCFTFRFADDRLIPLPTGGRRVSVFKIDPDTAERLRLLTATAGVSEGGWAGLMGPMSVRAGEALVAAPERAE